MDTGGKQGVEPDGRTAFPVHPVNDLPERDETKDDSGRFLMKVAVAYVLMIALVCYIGSRLFAHAMNQ
jgi:hypothetical protein